MGVCLNMRTKVFLIEKWAQTHKHYVAVDCYYYDNLQEGLNQTQ